MEIIYLLIPLSLILMGFAIWAFFWAVKSGQFDNLDSAALRILEDDHAEDINAHCKASAKPDSDSKP